MKRRVWWWVGLWLLGPGVMTLPAQTPNRIVAVVNNEIITLHELDKAFQQVSPLLTEKGKEDEIRKQLLLQLIDQKLIDLQVKRLGIQITDEEVDKTIQKIKEEQGLSGAAEFASALQKEGLSEGDFRNKIREQILRFRLVGREIGSKIVIPEERVKEHFEKNRPKYQRQEGLRLSLILLKAEGKGSEEERRGQRKKMEEIMEGLKRGEDFAELARRHSQDPSAASGGDLGVFSMEELDPAIRQTLSSLQAGQWTPILEGPQGWQILKVTEVIGKKEVGYAEVRDRIYNELFQEEVDKRFADWLQQIKERSHIQILL